MENRKALRAFYDSLAKEFTDFFMYYSSNPINFSRVTKILRMLNLDYKDTVCDVGCGDGHMLNQVKRIAPRVQGMDISEVRAMRTGLRGISAVMADASHIPFKPEQFDKVICSEVIEHVSSPEAVVSEIGRILKPNGQVVLSVPLEQVLGRTVLEVPEKELIELGWYQIKEKYGVVDAHIHSFTEQSIKELVESCGLTVNGIAFTWHHRIRSGMTFWYAYKIWRALITKLGENTTRIPLSKNIIFLVSSILYKKETGIRHHIIVRGVKRT